MKLRCESLSRIHSRHRLSLPRCVSGQRIGLLGGSFDPPHEGHVHITHWAVRKLELDQVWWLVSVRNPLKARQPAPVAERAGAAELLPTHPKVAVSRLEARIGSRHTCETLGYLRRRFPAARFVWLMGSDNLAALHEWRNWREIFSNAPVGVFSRPAHRAAVMNSRAARAFAGSRAQAVQPRALADMRPPAWMYLTIPLNSTASTAIRDTGQWKP